MISRAIDFCEIILNRNAVLYPFAVLSRETDLECVFVPNKQQQSTPNMIEELQNLMLKQTANNKPVTSLLVYSATVTYPHRLGSDALVFIITDSQGYNTITIYPYQHMDKGIEIDRPYTCDFSD